MSDRKRPLRSAEWFGHADKNGFMYRSWMKNQGIPDHEFQGKPIIGICNTWSELTPCNAHFRKLAEHVKQGVLEAGGTRGASTISQQTVKNLYLWRGRSWPRKALEALITPVSETIWSKRRILEIYLNIAEMAPGVYGAEAAARHHFGKTAAQLTEREAALIAAVLPNPRRWSAGQPTMAPTPAELTLRPRPAVFSRSMKSAIGLRQILPVQTTRMFLNT